MLPAARDAVVGGMERWANPSSTHAEGRTARAALEGARSQIATAYGWAGETILTSGASEALGMALGRSTRSRRIVSAVEHDAVLRSAPDAIVIPVEPGGRVSTDALAASMSSGASAIVAVQWANSETGVLQPITEIAPVIHARGDLLLVDAAQMPAGADRAVFAHADFVALSAHKHGGPPGIGALLVRDLSSLVPNGGQERGYRSGTENLPGALGYAAALEEPEPIDTWRTLRADLDEAVTGAGGEVVAEGQPRHPAIGSYRMPGVTAAAQLIRLDLAGISVSAGSACSSGSLKPSHVLGAMGYPEMAAREVIRVSFGRKTTPAEVGRFAEAWSAIARTARRFAA